MKKNQKYTQEEMYLAIELWQESGLSQELFCKREKISISTFSYWLRKYRKEKGSRAEDKQSFIPVEVMPSPNGSISQNSQPVGEILISYPNGIQVSCPVSVTPEMLVNLIKL